MKKFFIASIILAAATSLFAFDDSPFYTPNGGAKSWTETEFSITTKFGDYYRTPVKKYKHSFNNLGQEIESAEYSALDQLVDRILYTYTDDGQISSQSCFDSEGNLFWKINSVFDKNGVKTEENEYDAKGTLLGKTVYEYESPSSTGEAYYNGKGNLIWKNMFKYNENNQLSENSSYFSNGQLDVKKIYKYNDEGLLDEIVSYNSAGNMIVREVYIYNSDQTIGEYAVYGANGKRRARIFYKYDANKNIIKSTSYNIAQKFGTTVNEMIGQSDFSYEYPEASSSEN